MCVLRPLARVPPTPLRDPPSDDRSSLTRHPITRCHNKFQLDHFFPTSRRALDMRSQVSGATNAPSHAPGTGDGERGRSDQASSRLTSASAHPASSQRAMRAEPGTTAPRWQARRRRGTPRALPLSLDGHSVARSRLCPRGLSRATTTRSSRPDRCPASPTVTRASGVRGRVFLAFIV